MRKYLQMPLPRLQKIGMIEKDILMGYKKSLQKLHAILSLQETKKSRPYKNKKIGA
jgi:hypothetical protein